MWSLVTSVAIRTKVFVQSICCEAFCYEVGAQSAENMTVFHSAERICYANGRPSRKSIMKFCTICKYVSPLTIWLNKYGQIILFPYITLTYSHKIQSTVVNLWPTPVLFNDIKFYIQALNPLCIQHSVISAKIPDSIWITC